MGRAGAPLVVLLLHRPLNVCRALRCLRVAVWFSECLKFLPLLPHENLCHSLTAGEGQAGSFLRRCFGQWLPGTVLPCKYLHN